MHQATISALITNAALLLILYLIHELSNRAYSNSRLKQVANGVLIALTCLAIMSIPFEFIPGVVYDTRSILISVTALIFGPITTIITMIPAVAFRIARGGMGVLPGVAVILTSGILGLIWRRWFLPKVTRLRWLNVFIMGVIIHIVMIACQMLLPSLDRFDAVREIALPIMLIYPASTAVLFLLLEKQREFWHIRDELRQSEERLRQLFETMSQGVVCQDAEGKIVSANPEAERILGVTLEEMMGRSSNHPGWRTVYEDGTEMPGSEQPAMVALRTGKPCGPVVLGVYHPKLKGHVWLSVNATPVFEEDGTLSRVYTIFQDISAEKKAKQDYQFLFNSMVDGFSLHEIICDESGKPVDYRFLAVNPAFERIIGLKASDIIGRTVLEVLPGLEPYWIETYGKVALTGESVRFENYTAVTGKYFRVSAYQPAPGQFACTFSDDTQRVQVEKELFGTLARLRGLLDNSDSPIIVFDDKGRVVEMSAAAEKIMGLPRDEIHGRNVELLGLPGVLDKALKLSFSGAAAGHIIEGLDVFEIDGEKRFFESRLFPIETKNKDEKLFGYLGIDVTARIAAERALKESEEKYSSYIENAPYAVFVVDERGNYLDCNRAGSAITGYSKEEILRMNIRDFSVPDSAGEAVEYFGSLLQTGRMSAELKYRHKDGSVRWWTVDAVKIAENRFLGFSIDITDRKQAEEDLISLSKHDYLTGVYNRRFFEAELERLNADSRFLPISVIVGDINGVKFINDTFGHAAGDKHIIETSDILKSCCREGDILSRTGGDEFVILMPNTDSAAASEVMRCIQNALIEFDETNASDAYQHSVSLGCATKVGMDENLREIIKVAEGYMYQRKLLEHSSAHSIIVSSIKATMFEKSHETEEHAQRLVALSKAIGYALELPQSELDKLELLASLHDIGKVGIPDEILTKPAGLTEKEWIEMKRHPEIGYRIAKTSPELAPIAEGILCHHEWWNGRGYPQGLCGDNIPLISRIVAVVDAYDAMTNDRPYRRALKHEEALDRIRMNAGTQFDPLVAKIFTEVVFGPRSYM